MSVTEYVNVAKDNDEKVIEISLSDIVAFFRKNLRQLIIAALVGASVGALYAFSKPNLYTAQVTVLPEIQAKGVGSLGGLSSLAGLAGVNLENIGGSGTDAIRPDLYPTILQSVPFALDLLNRPVYSPQLREQITYQHFMEEMEKQGWLSKMMRSDDTDAKQPLIVDPKKTGEVLQVSKRQEEFIKGIQANVLGVYDKKTGVITIMATEPDPVVAATIARLSLDYLTNYITTYRTQKARNQVTFLQQRVADAEGRYKLTEYSLSAYRDRNQSLYTNTAKIEEQRLQADYLLAQSVYTDLLKQLEQAKIKVQEETPVFKTLDPPRVPILKSAPKRLLIILGTMFFSTFILILARVLKLLKGKFIK